MQMHIVATRRSKVPMITLVGAALGRPCMSPRLCWLQVDIETCSTAALWQIKAVNPRQGTEVLSVLSCLDAALTASCVGTAVISIKSLSHAGQTLSPALLYCASELVVAMQAWQKTDSGIL